MLGCSRCLVFRYCRNEVVLVNSKSEVRSFYMGNTENRLESTVIRSVQCPRYLLLNFDGR